jgi:hypothetical protein
MPPMPLRFLLLIKEEADGNTRDRDERLPTQFISILRPIGTARDLSFRGISVEKGRSLPAYTREEITYEKTVLL